MKPEQLDTPLNANERLLYGINARLEVLIKQFDSLITHIAEKDNVAVTQEKSVTAEAPKAAPKKRTTKRKEG